MAKRERNPTYMVFESHQMNKAEVRLAGFARLVDQERAADAEEGGALTDSPDATVTVWVEIATDVSAKTPRDAIAKATADRPVDDRAGTFWAPLASAFRPRSREVAVLHEDRWT